MNKEKKTEQINLRLTKSEKDMLYKNAGINGKNVTEYIINLIKNNSNSVSYEQYITDSMTENNIINNLLLSDKLSNKSKKIIIREVRKYVGYSNWSF